ncbi:histidine kinase dimerization/phospho-acceptor domain-containing protein [Streptomyces sp. NPDC002763]|uniref:histidine kinase dimerization/phospho-acceptor domain-containing protein n=1 Tax=Streptomyces sp. NPDC002763 TaxID=3154427 RepID=UPI003326CB7C
MRTPLTGLQLALEAGLAQDDDARLRPVLTEALATTQRLHRTVEELLRLSLYDSCCGRRRNGGTASSPRTADAWSASARTHRPTSVFRARP